MILKYSYFALECDAQERDWVKEMAIKYVLLLIKKIKYVLLSRLNPKNLNLAPVLVSKLR
jgi:hypothetical protein